LLVARDRFNLILFITVTRVRTHNRKMTVTTPRSAHQRL
jgi:hypothetical protein